MAQKDAREIVLTKPAKRVYDKASREITQRPDSCFEDLEKKPIYGNNIRTLTGQLKGLIQNRLILPVPPVSNSATYLVVSF